VPHKATGDVALRLSADEKKAIELRDNGLTIREIAAEMGCAVGTAFNRVLRGIRKLPQEAAKRVQDKEVAECDILMAESFSRAMKVGDEMKDWFMAVKAICMIKDRKARYLGLDAAKKVDMRDVSGMSDVELAKKAQELLEANRGTDNREQAPTQDSSDTD
jgi:hypothetical protein